MICPYVPNLFCEYIDTAGMDKIKECKDCEHFMQNASYKDFHPDIIIEPRQKNVTFQGVRWDTWHGIQFIKGDPKKGPAAFHLIYKWSLFLGWFEIRKFMTTEEMKKALEIYHNFKKL